jgi:hypothetical protein
MLPVSVKHFVGFNEMSMSSEKSKKPREGIIAFSKRTDQASAPPVSKQTSGLKELPDDIPGRITAEQLERIALEVEDAISELEKTQAITDEVLHLVVSI